MENQETFWVVWREGDRWPVVKYEGFDMAVSEAHKLADLRPGAKVYVLEPAHMVCNEPDPIKRVYEKYKNLDNLLSIRGETCIRELWQAIKDSQGGGDNGKRRPY